MADALDKAVAEVVLELNGLIAEEIAEMLRLLDPSSGDWRYHLSMTEDYLQVAIGPLPEQAAALALNLPTASNSDIEIWGRLSPEEVALLRLASLWDDSHQLLKSLLPEEEAKLLPPDVGVRSVGDWALVEVGRKE